MFWAFLLFAGLALLLVKLGALSAWMAVLKLGLMAAFLVIAALIAVLLWRRYLRRP